MQIWSNLCGKPRNFIKPANRTIDYPAQSAMSFGRGGGRGRVGAPPGRGRGGGGRFGGGRGGGRGMDEGPPAEIIGKYSINDVIR